MRRIGIAIVALVVVAAGALAFVLLRPSVVVTQTTASDVVIECTAATGVTADGCAAWGREVLDGGAPSRTFEMDDLARLLIDRPAFGFSAICEASYFISRDVVTPAWVAEVACI